MGAFRTLFLIDDFATVSLLFVHVWYPFLLNSEQGDVRKGEIVKNTKLGDALEQKTKVYENNKSKEYKDKKETEMKNTYVHYM